MAKQKKTVMVKFQATYWVVMQVDREEGEDPTKLSMSETDQAFDILDDAFDGGWDITDVVCQENQ